MMVLEIDVASASDVTITLNNNPEGVHLVVTNVGNGEVFIQPAIETIHLKVPHKAVDPWTEAKYLTRERDRLRIKVKNQRRELSRLNKYLGPYWAGFRRGVNVSDELRLRRVVNKAFGRDRVYAAELAELNEAGPLTGPQGTNQD